MLYFEVLQRYVARLAKESKSGKKKLRPSDNDRPRRSKYFSWFVQH